MKTILIKLKAIKLYKKYPNTKNLKVVLEVQMELTVQPYHKVYLHQLMKKKPKEKKEEGSTQKR